MSSTPDVAWVEILAQNDAWRLVGNWEVNFWLARDPARLAEALKTQCGRLSGWLVVVPSTHVTKGRGHLASTATILQTSFCGTILETVNEARQTFRFGPPAKWVAILCTLVIFISGSVEAAHFHSLESKTAPVRCSICILAHSNRSAAAACRFEFARPVLRATAFLTPSAVTAKCRLDCFARYVRPPPSV